MVPWMMHEHSHVCCFVFRMVRPIVIGYTFVFYSECVKSRYSEHIRFLDPMEAVYSFSRAY